MFFYIYNRQHQWKVLDNIRRRNYIKFEIKSQLIRSLKKTSDLQLTQKCLLIYKQSSIPRASSITRVVNRCVNTGRKYSTLRKFKLSRFSFRTNSYEGLLPGVRRNSW